MRFNGCRRILLTICVAASSFFLNSTNALGQDGRKSSPSDAASSETTSEIRVLADLIRDLQAQVQALTSQLGELRTEEQRTSQEAHDLRRELEQTKGFVALQPNPQVNSYPGPASRGAPSSSSQPAVPPTQATVEEQTPSDRIAKLEEDQQITEARVNEQYQTKIESGSKYRLRLSGIILLNLFDNRGTVDNQDFPQIAQPPQLDPLYVSPSSFGGTLRQSKIRLEAFGPDIAGAKTSASLEFDFAGGFPNTWNGVSMGLVRLRTGTVRFDWTNTSIIAGQDHLFFTPLAPTSLATLATPALSYAGNLWSWTPQVRIEHRMALTEASNLLFQAGILDSLTGDLPSTQFYRYPSWGEESGHPAYASRIAWSHRAFGQDLTIGFGGYYARQNWGFNRNVDGWAGTTDVTLPLGKRFEFTGQFYRGRAVAGLGGGIGQSVLFNGDFFDPTISFKGLDSVGGWVQLKFKPRTNFEINGAIGLDNPFASELRLYTSNPFYVNSYSRNLSPLVNFIYQIRSDVLFSTEYRRLQTSVIDSKTNDANHVNFSLGYIF